MPAAPDILASPDFLEQWALTGGFKNGHPTSFKFTPDGSEVLFLRSGPRDTERALYAFDVATRTERELLTASSLLQGGTERLSPEERALRERLRMTASGITSFELSRDGRRVLVPLSGRLFVFEREPGETIELPSDGGYANGARFSPDGSKVACVRSGDLYVIEVESRRQRRLTSDASETVTNGLAEFIAQEEMSRYRGFWWSPDSQRILYQQTDNARVEVLYASNPIDPTEQPQAARYPRAGTENASVRLGVVATSGGPTRWVEWDRAGFPYLTTARWSDGSPLTIVVQDRLQQRAQLLTVDPRSGETRKLHEETDAAWLNIDQSVPSWVDAEHYLWSTERDGAWQLELRSISGEAPRFVTSAELGYSELLHVEGQDAVWVAAHPSPTETHVYRVPLAEGSEAQRITSAEGTHEGAFGPEGLWALTSHTLADGVTVTLRRGATDVVAPLRSVAEPMPFVPMVEYVEIGPLRFHALVVRPRNFERGRKYPVLLNVYAGPGHISVRKGRDLQLREQWQADHGFIVVSLDGRGTPRRGREWERVIRGNLIDVALGDQVAGLRALGERFEELDLDRVGVYGWSFGGYFSAMAVMREPELFRVGVAGAPVCDWHDYDTHYTERFMGLPESNRAGYDASSVLTHAPMLTRPLMIIHGTSDDNVYFTHALKMSDALLRAGRPHELVVLGGSTHMVADPDVAKSLQGRIMGFLAASLR